MAAPDLGALSPKSTSKVGLPTADEQKFIDKVLGELANKQSGLFMRWCDEVDITGIKGTKKRLLILTPLRLIIIKNKTFGRGVEKQMRMVWCSAVIKKAGSLRLELVFEEPASNEASVLSLRSTGGSSAKVTQCSVGITFAEQSLIDEFYGVLDWSLYLLNRGLPEYYRCKYESPLFEEDGAEEAGWHATTGQFALDRYIASCDAHGNNAGVTSSKNNGVRALTEVVRYFQSLIERQITSEEDSEHVFDLGRCLTRPPKKRGGEPFFPKRVDIVHIWSISHAISFSTAFDVLLLDSLPIEDSHVAVMLTCLETNTTISTLELRAMKAGKKAFNSLRIALELGSAPLRELNLIDDEISHQMVGLMMDGLAAKKVKLRTLRITNSSMNAKACDTLCTRLVETGQHKSLHHLNLSHNDFGKPGSKALAELVRSSESLMKLILSDCNLDKNDFLTGAFRLATEADGLMCHTHTLQWLDLSDNNIGDTGAIALGNFISSSKVLNYLRMSHCSMDEKNFQKVFHGCVENMNGFLPSVEKRLNPVAAHIEAARLGGPDQLEKKRSSIGLMKLSGLVLKEEINTGTVPFRPTQTDILESTNLVCLSLDFSNMLGFNGKHVTAMVQELNQRENYTIVSLNLAYNLMSVDEMYELLLSLGSVTALERINLNECIKQGPFGKGSDKEGLIGQGLVRLLNTVPPLHEVSISGRYNKQDAIGKGGATAASVQTTEESDETGSGGSASAVANAYLDSQSLVPLFEQFAYLSNLDFLDVSGNRIGDRIFSASVLPGLSKNRFLKVFKFDRNSIKYDSFMTTLQIMIDHDCMFGEVPLYSLKQVSKKSSKTQKQGLKAALDMVESILAGNRERFELEENTTLSLPPKARVERELRLQKGVQFGISIERIRGTIKLPDYESRIPYLLVRLKSFLVTKGGLDLVGIFRLAPEKTLFDSVKRTINANIWDGPDYDRMDVSCAANAIKVWCRDLPCKLLNAVPKKQLDTCHDPILIPPVIDSMPEPYKSIFSWMLDLCVEIVNNCEVNKMDSKNMSIVLSPNLYEMDSIGEAAGGMPTASELMFAESLQKFTTAAINWRLEYRKEHPVGIVADALASPVPSEAEAAVIAASASAAASPVPSDVADEGKFDDSGAGASGPSRSRSAITSPVSTPSKKGGLPRPSDPTDSSSSESVRMAAAKVAAQAMMGGAVSPVSGGGLPKLGDAEVTRAEGSSAPPPPPPKKQRTGDVRGSDGFIERHFTLADMVDILADTPGGPDTPTGRHSGSMSASDMPKKLPQLDAKSVSMEMSPRPAPAPRRVKPPPMMSKAGGPSVSALAAKLKSDIKLQESGGGWGMPGSEARIRGGSRTVTPEIRAGLPKMVQPVGMAFPISPRFKPMPPAKLKRPKSKFTQDRKRTAGLMEMGVAVGGPDESEDDEKMEEGTTPGSIGSS